MLPTPRINAHAPLWRLVDALAASGWGELRDAPQSVRTYLLALGRIADARTGIAETTDAQVAERAGLSVRTIIRARTWLQDYGLLEQLRRGARQGLTGVASLLRLGKRALAAMLPGARAAKDARERRRAQREGGAPNLTARHAFPSLRRKTGAAPRWGVRPPASNVQQQLRDDAAHAASAPARPETI
ncbi:MAG: helix-turn-helix domain-containing protein, partial [Promicromonosporaceae bacterium]|nr:helix-turn-helix domain-containing protein [Promicromonosporaceae bacterium]